ncbi:hypothetical protein CA264_15150 [Pontibacter actiniarum]|uniref:Uncharacterized protein n=1 Tax=Pontibacter actiniarum TaxID=323450 RepID=A0A1X9YUR5_9BACT|nr:hypothetical protein CA264_15150 [Pontibacter actiniarum]
MFFLDKSSNFSYTSRGLLRPRRSSQPRQHAGLPAPAAQRPPWPLRPAGFMRPEAATPCFPPPTPSPLACPPPARLSAACLSAPF